ncbi:hypothetical protein M3650_18165 [Paenibacillus sp. MER TA 81-3]|uniref:hypothetical protein n=1 Tax=Paenibacillus sp. MER TA 81-3 TaxID=2939573 RepID=UPI00203D0ABB|nr:hypothetical protein [Paenibacillus sp. MER TA 81-3]MCM3340512.1 hypothetical protein [Paenibacillus sp. MER TA 81-3]
MTMCRHVYPYYGVSPSTEPYLYPSTEQITETESRIASLPVLSFSVVANGYRGLLQIQNIGNDGTVTGTIFGEPLIGFWDENSLKLTFQRLTTSSPTPQNPYQVLNATAIQIYTGYLFTDVTNRSLYTLAGSFEAFHGTGGTASKTVFGWFAQALRT